MRGWSRIMSLMVLCLFCGTGESRSVQKPAPVGNATTRLSVLTPKQVKDPYYRAVVTELQAFRPRRLLLESDSTETYRQFSFDNREGRAIKEDTPVSGQLFARAWEIK